MALAKVVVAWIECLNVLENLEIGDTTVEHCLRPGSSTTLRLEKPLQLLPELSLAYSFRFLWVLDLTSLGTPGSLSQYLDEYVTAHGASSLVARQEPTLATAEHEDVSFEEALEPPLELCFQGFFLYLC